jgi:hypothetical protein
MKTKTYTLNQLRAMAIGWEQQLCKAIVEDAPIEQITEMSKSADLWRSRLIVAEEERKQLGKIEWTYEVGDDRPTALHYAWVALGVTVAVCSIPFIVEAIVWVASVWGL